jgi:3-oxoacyl-[acyl-carrier-protein] synthase-3
MRLAGIGASIPETVVTNAEIEARLRLEQGWIERRTGIKQRPTAALTDATSDLAVRAGERALRSAGISRADVGILLLATSTPDHLLPPTAPLVAHRLGLDHAGAVDLTGACAGFLYALTLANSYGEGIRRPAVVIAANILTRRVNPNDAATSSLFSDGAGAVVLAILGSFLHADGSLYDTIGIPAGGTRDTLTPEAVAEGRHLMTMRKGSALFKQAVHAMAAAGRDAMNCAGLTPSDIDWWIPHQANLRIIQDAGALLGIPPERTINVIARYGNSSAATIPIALAHEVESGRVKREDVVLMTAAGAGLVSAGLILRW